MRSFCTISASTFWKIQPDIYICPGLKYNGFQRFVPMEYHASRNRLLWHFLKNVFSCDDLSIPKIHNMIMFMCVLCYFERSLKFLVALDAFHWRQKRWKRQIISFVLETMLRLCNSLCFYFFAF